MICLNINLDPIRYNKINFSNDSKSLPVSCSGGRQLKSCRSFQRSSTEVMSVFQRSSIEVMSVFQRSSTEVVSVFQRSSIEVMSVFWRWSIEVVSVSLQSCRSSWLLWSISCYNCYGRHLKSWRSPVGVFKAETLAQTTYCYAYDGSYNDCCHYT